MTARARDNRHRFTIIELLVVIAIITILAALLLPALSLARAHARKTRCTGNLRNFSIAMMSYRDDHETTPCWLSSLYPDYMPDTKVYICPEDVSAGHDGGRPGGEGDIQEEPISDILQDDYPETDDTDRNDERTVGNGANPYIERCSYMYEFANVECGWGPYWLDLAAGIILPSNPTWAEVKESQLKYGNDLDGSGNYGDPYQPSLFPAIRCFYHWNAMWGNRELVLNVGYDGSFFLSRSEWEQGVY